jgi:tetratricopeptide (TPR) repeat protein
MTDSTELLNEAKRQVEAQAWEKGEELYRRVLETHEHDAEAYYGLGLVALARGRHAEAKTLFQAAIERDPSNANAIYYVGYIAEKAGEAETAVAVYGAALAANPRHAGALARLAALAQRSSPSVPSGFASPREPPLSQPGSAAQALPQPPRSPKSKDSYVGLVRDLQRRLYPRGPGKPLEAVTFLLQAFDDEGRPQPPVSVEIRATNVRGALANDHWVEIAGKTKQRHGNLRPKRFHNLSTGSDVYTTHL